jgi:hypothetical protein
VTQPLSKAELLELPPVINLATLGKALGLSEPVVRERARKNEFAALGIRVLQLAGVSVDHGFLRSAGWPA